MAQSQNWIQVELSQTLNISSMHFTTLDPGTYPRFPNQHEGIRGSYLHFADVSGILLGSGEIFLDIYNA